MIKEKRKEEAESKLEQLEGQQLEKAKKQLIEEEEDLIKEKRKLEESKSFILEKNNTDKVDKIIHIKKKIKGKQVYLNKVNQKLANLIENNKSNSGNIVDEEKIFHNLTQDIRELEEQFKEAEKQLIEEKPEVKTREQLEEQLELAKKQLIEAEKEYNEEQVNTFNSLLEGTGENKNDEVENEKNLKNNLYKKIKIMIENSSHKELEEIYNTLNYTNIPLNNFINSIEKEKNEGIPHETNSVKAKLNTLEFAKTAQKQDLITSIIEKIEEMMDDLTPEQLKEINITLGTN